MAQMLPPTVYERVAHCNERILVDGISSGALVELHIGTDIYSTVVAANSHAFAVPAVNAGDVIRSRQDDGSGFTPFSATVIVENAFVPPVAAPSLPEEIEVCSQCVRVTHVTPGALVELISEGELVGAGWANRHGAICVQVDLRELRGKPGAILRAQQTVCGAPGPFAERVLVAHDDIPQPSIGGPVFGCQNVVPVSGARPGAVLQFESDSGDSLGQLCSCWRNVNVGVIRPLVVGERIRARCGHDREPCSGTGDWSDWRLIEPPDERIMPEVREVIYQGDQVIRVSNQIPGATLTVLIAEASGGAVEEFGPRPVGLDEEISLAAPLMAGNEIVVAQTLCGVRVASDPVVVEELPPEIFAPVLVAPMYECGQAVQVSNLHPGALVRVLMDGIPIGQGWASTNNSIAVSTSHLEAGRRVTAVQTLGSVDSLPSNEVVVAGLGRFHQPRIMGPVAEGDRAVWVSGVMPGARISIRSGGFLENPKILVGEIDAAEPVVRVPIDGTLGSQPLLSIVAQVRFCSRTIASDAESVLLSPLAIPEGGAIEEDEELMLGSFQLPPEAGGFLMDVRGHLYRPKAPHQTRTPLVIVAHGFHFGTNMATGEAVDSAIGYGYLARHLARWGMTVFSVDLQPINDALLVSDIDAATSHRARAEIIFRSIELLESRPETNGLIDVTRIGLVGHSMGGDAVGFTQVINVNENRGFSIRGVVAIAPTNWLPDYVFPSGKYLQIFGALDQLTSFIPAPGVASAYGGLRIYDRAAREKTLFWLHGMRHNPFNSEWVGAGDVAEVHIADLALSEGEHQRAARFLINAFFQDSLMARPQYAGYMHGVSFPRAVSHLNMHASHSAPGVVVIDNHGDVDAQSGLLEETPLDKGTNSLGGANQVIGTLAAWENGRITDTDNAPHESYGVRLAWDAPGAILSADLTALSAAGLKVLSLRLAQVYEDPVRNAGALPSDAFVSLDDGTHTATVRVGAVAQVPFPDAASRVNTTLRTIRLPLDAFQALNPALNLLALRMVTVRFDAKPAGHLIGDDFEIGE